MKCVYIPSYRYYVIWHNNELRFSLFELIISMCLCGFCFYIVPDSVGDWGLLWKVSPRGFRLTNWLKLRLGFVSSTSRMPLLSAAQSALPSLKDFVTGCRVIWCAQHLKGPREHHDARLHDSWACNGTHGAARVDPKERI